ncbi:hypothetical protein AC578_5072 [Pseudocercospora eumusae]|uniref:BTB domain-containing protein n=1 Tax=Pseudocercospora eumusae TaxID=321146 RepID=A0A139HIE3_9PEZI|nr:hypothetical protein AC578_5072 [Pseudocercospora eumusae]
MDQVAELASAFKADELIKIELEDGGIFTVQKATLCHRSPYFKAALEENKFKEGMEKKLRLPGCTTKAFEMFLYWMIHSNIPHIFDCFEVHPPIPDPSQGRDKRSDEFQVTLVQLWVLADILLLPELRDKAILSISGVLCEYHVAVDAVKAAFQETGAKSEVSKEVIDHLVRDSGVSGIYGAEEMDALGAITGVLLAFNNKLIEQYGPRSVPNKTEAGLGSGCPHLAPW